LDVGIVDYRIVLGHPSWRITINQFLSTVKNIKTATWIAGDCGQLVNSTKEEGIMSQDPKALSALLEEPQARNAT
jgi:bacterioferritin-associated ferredoxin